MIYAYKTKGNSSVRVRVLGAATLEGFSVGTSDICQLFPFQGRVCFVVKDWLDGDLSVYSISADETSSSFTKFKMENFYEPVVISGCPPAGGGTTLESLNILTDNFRAQYSSDGEATVYMLPDIVNNVDSVIIDNFEYHLLKDIGHYESETNQFTFTQAPPKGVNNVVFRCRLLDQLNEARKKFCAMPYYEHFSGDTDNRVFFYGDGTNVCYYTGIPAFGAGLYLPAGNEICVDFSDSPITAMIRQYGKLLAMKPDGVDAIVYEPVTLADGTVTAGFYARPMHRELGNEAPGQVRLIENSPRSFCKGGLYDWRVGSAYYRDERYAKAVGEEVSRTLSSVDPSRLITCDDAKTKTYYMFLNDAAGTILIHRYDLDVWTLYRSQLAAPSDLVPGVSHAFVLDGKVTFCNGADLFVFDDTADYDAPTGTDADAPNVPIAAKWESGFMAFGAENLRKFSGEMWISMKPEPRSLMTVTAATDRRDAYVRKKIGANLHTLSNMNYGAFSYNLRTAPQLRRLRLKVKKFAYYKLIFSVDTPGARATVLGINQQVRFASPVK